MKRFQLQEEEYLNIFRTISDHDTYDEAFDAGLKLFDSGKLEDFAILCLGEPSQRVHYNGYQLIEQECPRCGKKVRQIDMRRTCDCRGIPFRMVCGDCFELIDLYPGYDGEYYDELDEQIEADY